MDTALNSFEQIAAHSKDCARLFITIGENRLELLAVEMQEEIQHIIHMIVMGFVVAAFGLLAGISFTASMVFILKSYPPATVLLSLTGLYGVVGTLLYWRFTRLRRNWQILSASLAQIRKDRSCREGMAI